MRRVVGIIGLALALAIGQPVAAQQKDVDVLLDRAKTAMIAEPESALQMAEDAERQSRNIASPSARDRAIATALWLQSEALIRSRNEVAAAPRISRALRLISNDPAPSKLRGDLLLARAGVQQAQLRPAEALASLQEAFALFGKVGERRSQSIALQTIATLYTQANDFASADKYFKQASEVYEGDPRLRLFLHNNRGNVLLRLGKNGDATAQYRQALAVARTLDSAPLLPPILVNLARALLAGEKFGQADEVIAEALRLIRSDARQSNIAAVYAIAAESARVQGNLVQAQRLITRSFAGTALDETSMAYRDAHLTAYHIYRARNEQGMALLHLERVRKLGDEAAQLATSTNTALMAARFDYANQELRIANLKAEELRRAAAFQRTIFLGLGGATFIIIVLLSIGLFTIRRSRNQVRQANAVLNETNVALEKALKAKTEFLATTSHEIRTPLNGILGMTQIMLRDPAVPVATRDRLGIVHGAGMTMRALVDDILDVAKMETGNLTVELVTADLHATLRDLTRMWEEQARAKGLSFTLDIGNAPRWIRTDADRMRQMLFNLLSNAVKFTERGEVSVRAETADGRLRLTVADSGIGIPDDKHEEIFESFRQVDAGTTRKFGGTGLGLAIVRNLARALGGDVAVTSVLGEGTAFTIDLPLETVDAGENVDAPPGGAGIVVLDRNPIARGMLRTLLEPRFSSVIFAATPDEAVALLPPSGTMLMLIDEATMKAAHENWLAALKALAEAVGGRSVRMAVLLGQSNKEIIAQINGLGIDLVLAKPISGATLVDCLCSAAEENYTPSVATCLVPRAA